MNIHSLYQPFQRFFRKKTMNQFVDLFSVDESTRILDVGGNPFNWALISAQPQVTMVNLAAPSEKSGAWMHFKWVIADAMHLPFKDNSFDIAYSNSVIEHLYSLENQQRFAGEIGRVGSRVYVQTPNKHFFIEPHLLTPLIHFFPQRIQRMLLRNFTVCGLVTRPSPQQCEHFLKEVRLLDRGDITHLFPDHKVIRERFLLFTKSFLVVSDPVLG